MSFKLYKSYSFKDKDPIIDRMRTIVQNSGESYGSISNMSGVSSTCINNWFNGPTKRPQHASLMAVARALGYELVLRKTNSKTPVLRLEARKRA